MLLSSASTWTVSLCGAGGDIFDLDTLSFHVPLKGLSAASKPSDRAKTTSNTRSGRISFPPSNPNDHLTARTATIVLWFVFQRYFENRAPWERPPPCRNSILVGRFRILWGDL